MGAMMTPTSSINKSTLHSLRYCCNFSVFKKFPILYVCVASMFWGLYSTLFGGLNSSKATSPVNCHPSITNNSKFNSTVSSILSVCICLRETICVNNWMSLIFLVFARSSAYFDYTLYMLLFLTKARNLRKWLSCTPISEFINLTDSHNLHVFAGTIVSFEVLSHSFFHLLRWAVNNELRLIWYSQTGYTGLITLCLTPLIAWPMMCRRCKTKVSYETRKILHYLSIIWVYQYVSMPQR